MEDNFKINSAAMQDAIIIKNMINKMYGFEYEKRDNKDIAEAILNKKEVYVLGYKDGKCVGFSGASIDNEYYADIITPDCAVIDYIFVEQDERDISLSLKLIFKLLKQLVNLDCKKAIMQVQTFNKQRYFHYALSDKNIIKSTVQENKNGKYTDQILLIEDLKKTANMSIREFMLKTYKFSCED